MAAITFNAEQRTAERLETVLIAVVKKSIHPLVTR